VKKLFMGTALGIGLAALAIGSAGAAPAPGGGPEFGLHVAEMTPEHPVEHGAMVGDCVSDMATTASCPHHE